MSGASFGRIELEIDGDGPPVVFLHGLGATSSSFQPLLPALHGFRCIRPDFPGAGRSPRPYVPVTIDFLCETTRDIVKGIAGAPAHVVAHSVGTLVAQHLAVAACEWGARLSLATKLPSPEVEAFVRESHFRQDPEGFAESCEALASAKGADLGLMNCPTLLVTGDEDPIASPGAVRGLAERSKGAKLKTLPRCGHWTPIEQPKECARLASEHIRAHA